MHGNGVEPPKIQRAANIEMVGCGDGENGMTQGGPKIRRPSRGWEVDTM